MNDQQKSIAQACLEGAESDRINFPQIIAALTEAGFESYAIDFRRSTATYYLPDGKSVELSAHMVSTPVAAMLDPSRMKVAITEAQQHAPGYSYRGFCEKAASAGCASYIVSLSGRRALYIGRTAETYIEFFPAQ